MSTFPMNNNHNAGKRGCGCGCGSHKPQHTSFTMLFREQTAKYVHNHIQTYRRKSCLET